MYKIYEEIKEMISVEVQQLKRALKEELINECKEDKYLTRKEAAKYLKVSLATIDNYVKKGLKKYKLGRSTRFLKSDIDLFIKN